MSRKHRRYQLVDGEVIFADESGDLGLYKGFVGLLTAFLPALKSGASSLCLGEVYELVFHDR